jgi:hypothetical protein
MAKTTPNLGNPEVFDITTPEKYQRTLDSILGGKIENIDHFELMVLILNDTEHFFDLRKLNQELSNPNSDEPTQQEINCLEYLNAIYGTQSFTSVFAKRAFVLQLLASSAEGAVSTFSSLGKKALIDIAEQNQDRSEGIRYCITPLARKYLSSQPTNAFGDLVN